MYYKHDEFHRIERIGWLRAAVLGANDGIISIASLLLGVAAANTTQTGILIAGVAALIAGAMSMAAGEYISVSSQADAENAEIQREKHELASNLPSEIEELTLIYIERGLEPSLAAEVAKQLMAYDASGSHIRDELGITTLIRARPLQAAIFSAASFTVGAIFPIIVVLLMPEAYLIPGIFVIAILLLASLGGLAAKVGGSGVITGIVRVTLWGTLAMLLTAIIGSLFGASI